MPKTTILLCLIALLAVACKEKPAGTIFKLYGNKVTFRLPGNIYNDTTLPVFQSDINIDKHLFYYYFLNMDTSILMEISGYKENPYTFDTSLTKHMDYARYDNGSNYFFETTLQTKNGIALLVLKSSSPSHSIRRCYHEYSETVEDSIVCRMEFGTCKMDSLTFWSKCDSIRGSLRMNLKLAMQ